MRTPWISDGQCRCGAVRFSVRWPIEPASVPGLAQVAGFEFVEGKDHLVLSPQWQLCSQCGTTLFHRFEPIVVISTMPAVMSDVNALHRAAQKGDAQEVRRLLQRGMPVNALWDNQTPWMLAAQHQHQEVCQILRDHGAELPVIVE